jgi:hypothetical protein
VCGSQVTASRRVPAGDTDGVEMEKSDNAAMICSMTYTTEDEMDSLIDSCVLFLTAYSAQLRRLTLRLYDFDRCSRLMKSAFGCSLLEELTVTHGGDERQLPGSAVWYPFRGDQEPTLQDSAVASLSPLLHLTSLCLCDLQIRAPTLSQLLGHCPVLTRVHLRSNLGDRRDFCDLPPSLHLADDRVVHIVYCSRVQQCTMHTIQ